MKEVVVDLDWSRSSGSSKEIGIDVSCHLWTKIIISG